MKERSHCTLVQMKTELSFTIPIAGTILGNFSW